MIKKEKVEKKPFADGKQTSELRRTVTANLFEQAYVEFIKQADKNAKSNKAQGSKTPFGFSEKPKCDGAYFKAQYGQGSPSAAPYMNWWVVSIYYLPSTGNVIIGIEEDRYPRLGEMKINPLGYCKIGNKKTNVAIYYETIKETINYGELYEKFIQVCEEVMQLGLNSSEHIQVGSMYVGITNANWMKFIKEQKDNIGKYINFWTPGTKSFKAIEPGELFLFKLHAKKSKGENGEIVGGAYFDRFEQMSVSEAWNRFGYGNGTTSEFELKSAIDEYRILNNIERNADIGCIVLREPFFFKEDKWIEAPTNWGKSIVSGKKYDISKGVGYDLYQEVIAATQDNADEVIISNIETEADNLQIVGKDREAFIKVRANQGIFRERLLEKYECCCLCKVCNPKFLVASHIKPWANSEADEKLDSDNGLLLCPNHDALFDAGYISFDDNGNILISEQLGEADAIFMNVDKNMKIHLSGKNKKYLEYHRNNIFRK